jgi:preprotein translocase subunit SecA
MLTNRIEGAQRRVEEHNFEIRKNVIKYDDVLNTQRGVVYEQRRRVLDGEDISDLIREWIDETVWGVVDAHTEEGYAEEWDLEGMMVGLRGIYPVSFTLEELGDPQSISKEDLLDRVAADAQHQYEAKEAIFSRIDPANPDLLRHAERFYLLQSIDQHWRQHLDDMDYLEKGIGLRGLAQKDPLVEYRTEGHAMFADMMKRVEEEVIANLFHLKLEVADGPNGSSQVLDVFDPAHAHALETLIAQHEEAASLAATANAGGGGGGAFIDDGYDEAPEPLEFIPEPVEQRRVEQVVGRNDPCWCGSGKKFKRCHGA